MYSLLYDDRVCVVISNKEDAIINVMVTTMQV